METARPHSLRRRLLFCLGVSVALAALLQVGLAYRSARSAADELFDSHMQQTAYALGSGWPMDMTPADAQGTVPATSGPMAVQVWRRDGLLVFRSPGFGLPQRAPLGFSELAWQGARYRIFSMQSPLQVVQVAQDMAERTRAAVALAVRSVAPVALMAPLLLLAVWWVVSRSLAPVGRVRMEVASRRPDDLAAVQESGLPDEIRPLVHELNLLFGRLRRAFAAQERFVADAAHELRSPLAALHLQIQGLRRAGDEAARARATQRLAAGAERATRIVEQLLALARLQAGTGEGLREQPVILADIVAEAVAASTEAAFERGVDLGVLASDRDVIQGHAEPLRMLVQNLLDNALRHGSPGGGTINLSLRRTGRRLVLCVEDSGAGIPPQDRDRLTQPFQRGTGVGVPGSGLGLAIVKSIAELHGATVRLDRSPALGGLCVEVAFPCSG